METQYSTDTTGNARAVVLSLVGAVAVASFLVWLTYVKPETSSSPPWIGSLAPLSAIFNTICASLLIAGFLAIRRRQTSLHRGLMLGALFFSALFFVSYVTKHYFEGDTIFGGSEWIRNGYLLMLATHVFGSVVVLILLPITLRFAILSRFASHRRLNRWLFPIWLYVSVTGVLVYLLLRSFGS